MHVYASSDEECDLVKTTSRSVICDLSGSRITLAPRPTQANHVKDLIFRCPWLRTGLLPLYCDENNDLVADVPTKLRDPFDLDLCPYPSRAPFGLSQKAPRKFH